MSEKDILPLVRGFILMNVFGFRLKESDFWNKMHEEVSGEGINTDAFKIMRLSTAEELFDDERAEAQEAINKLSIERPDIFPIMSGEIERLRQLI